MERGNWIKEEKLREISQMLRRNESMPTIYEVKWRWFYKLHGSSFKMLSGKSLKAAYGGHWVKNDPETSFPDWLYCLFVLENGCKDSLQNHGFSKA